FGWDIDTQWSTNRGELLPVGSYGHTGFTGTSVWIDPATKTYIILMTNAVHPRLTGDSWGKVSLRTKVATAVTDALAVEIADKQREQPLAITGYNEAASVLRRPVARNAKVMNGIDVLMDQKFAPLQGKTIGLLTNP